MKCRPMCAIWDTDFSEGRETCSHGGYWLGDDPGEGVENSCLWIHTA